VDEENMVYIHSDISRNEILSFAAKWKELGDITSSKISQTQEQAYVGAKHFYQNVEQIAGG
jgi:hypothetical protein